MLKLTYTETSFCLECLVQSLEEWVQARVILALRVGQSLCVEPSTASFLLPVNLPGVEILKTLVNKEDNEIIALCGCDNECVEVILRGYWLSNGSQDADGIFVTAMSDSLAGDVLGGSCSKGDAAECPSMWGDRSASCTEFFLQKLWQEAQHRASVMSE
ncbi:alr0857 family protein [Brasilonema sp. UFV-L1]|uniref:alr0857 family protein n=1 Tax=Brasilonema sp. UFV-L1 TaxID=2234130 RepID=UPI00145EF6D3|nr:alr0857 family protein [Brasilonema sp. UFV-L1]NMG07040.1 hypothetical protein [Brasilonema sp. UFV-L1]